MQSGGHLLFYFTCPSSSVFNLVSPFLFPISTSFFFLDYSLCLFIQSLSLTLKDKEKNHWKKDFNAKHLIFSNIKPFIVEKKNTTKNTIN